MLDRAFRLTKKFEFQRVKKFGQNVVTPFFIFSFLQNPPGPARFGFIVSKKVDKRATARNRLRRLLSEVVRLFLAENNRLFPFESGGVDVVFIVRRGALGKSYAQISASLHPLLSKVFKL